MNQLPTSRASSRASSRPLRVAIVAASWHRDIVSCATTAARAELVRQGVPDDRIDLIEVPGAFEIPLHAQTLAKTAKYAAVVGCALVVDGGIYRHEFVTTAVIDGLMRVQLDTGLPVFSAVLTPHQFHEHAVHQQFFREHFVVKGTEVAQACLATLASLERLGPLVD